MFIGLEHAAIASPDPAKLAQWYVEHLGFQLNYRSSSSKTTFVKAPDGSMIEIIASQGDRGPQTMKDPGLRHLAVAVDDFDACYGKLKSEGVQFTGEPTESKGNKLVFFTDLDGNYLHLIQREKPLP